MSKDGFVRWVPKITMAHPYIGDEATDKARYLNEKFNVKLRPMLMRKS
jgi:hypothetical protein